MPDDRIVQDGYLLKEEPEPEVGTRLRHHSAEWVKHTHTRQEWEVGRGTDACLLPSFHSGPALSLTSLSR